MGYEALKDEERKICNYLADEMIAYATDLMKKDAGFLGGFLVSGLMNIAGPHIKQEAKKTTSEMIDFFIEKGKEYNEGRYDTSNILSDFEKQFGGVKCGEDEKEGLREIICLEIERYDKLIRAGGSCYEDIFKNAYSTKEEALSDLNAVFEKELNFFSSVPLIDAPVSNEIKLKVGARAVDLRRKTYETIINRVFRTV